MHRTQQNRAEAIIGISLRFLRLTTSSGCRYVAKILPINKYNNDPSVYSKQIESLERGQFDSLSYPVIRDSLKYVEMLCRGLLK